MALTGTWVASGSITLGLWARIGGNWTKVGTTYANAYGSYTTGGVKTLNWSTTKQVSASGAVDAFRVVLESINAGDAAAITAFSSVSWQVQSSSSTRSATPNGEKITATVRPV